MGTMRAELRNAYPVGEGYLLRRAQPEEYGAVGDVLVSAFTHGCWITENYQKRLTAIEQWAETSDIWVIASASGTIYAAVTTPKPEEWPGVRFTFNVLGVAPAGRGHGFGAALVKHCIALAEAYGYEEIELHSSPHMTHAHQLYYRFGFHRRIDWETMVIDSGQRLFAFSRSIAWNTDSNIWKTDSNTSETHSEAVMATTNSSPHAHTAAAGTAVLRYSPLDPRSWPAVIGARLHHWPVTVDLSPSDVSTIVAGTGVSLNGGGAERKSTWRECAGQMWHGDKASDPDARWMISAIEHDLIDTLFAIATEEQAAAKEALRRVFYARLGWFDALLETREYLGGNTICEPDAYLFGVLITFDMGYRSFFPFGDAAVVDYPNLWRYARRLYQEFRHAGIVTDADTSAIGLTPRSDGTYAAPWGPLAWTETVDDLRAAWTGVAER
ncbi:MAG: GNAT family N-acetyltransferase [Ancrocorticia sp.]|nr:GNAT family N-acetyltransferase [Ancrocorticia sp.]MCI2192862.1 GNAT family N-acetyltransferase [Ancrocorticia sp.]